MRESTSASRVTLDGRFFRLGDGKYPVKGVTYGPFTPSAASGTLPSRTQVLIDLDLIQQLGANTLRLYDVPPSWFLDIALAHDLRVFIDIPWARHLCFLDRKDQQQAALNAVRQAARSCAGHPAVFAYSVANEIPAEIVRWHGARRTSRFLESLMQVARENDPGCLCTFTSFPSTEYLTAGSADFICYNVFLHHSRAYEAYLDRLQLLAGHRPLILGETGIDTLRMGEAQQAEILSWQIECAFRRGLAGLMIFSFTDDWYSGDRLVEDWAFGVTTRQRQFKQSYRVVQRQFRTAPYFRLARLPRVSVVIACHNGQRTLKACLEAATQLAYPDFEIILVDDGSTDATSQIVLSCPNVRYIHQQHHGLSVARNTGIAAATGEIIAFTDADCRPDEDWLYYLVQELLREGVAGAGGPNYLPPDDSRVAAAVMASPGGPTHVMLTDRDAEHVPGCNMAFWRWALEELGGFDPAFHQAGDDVDLCWRLLERGRRIGFSAGAMVWHYRRSTVRAYLAQQFGYGEAEALLARKHPEYFNALGTSQWRGRIYSFARPSASLHQPVIYRGTFGTALFQRVYDPGTESWLAGVTSVEFHAFITLPLLALGAAFPGLLPVGLAGLALSTSVAIVAGLQAELPRRQRAFWSRPLVSLLYFLQPIVRGWARHRWRFTARSVRPTTFRRSDAARPRWFEPSSQQLCFFSEAGIDRLDLLRTLVRHLQEESWEFRTDTGWGDFDVEVFGRRWSRLRLLTATEELGRDRRVLRCRLQSRWSSAAHWAVGLLAGAELVLLMAAAPGRPWAWLSLLALPLLVGAIEYERRLVLQLIRAMVNDFASRLKLPHLLPPTPADPRPGSPVTAPTPKDDALEELL
jgi:O-antigen biosynthesis protein